MVDDEYEIRGRLRIINTKFGRLIYITDSSGSELGRVDLADGVDLFNFLSQMEVEDDDSE